VCVKCDVVCVSSFLVGFTSTISLMVEMVNKEDDFLSELCDPSSDNGM